MKWRALTLILITLTSWAHASGPTIAPETLTREISARMNRVQEFRVVREACLELKMRCWLFGGTAAGYGHFVKWDLQREAGDARFLKERFESYDFTDIYRSTQDADLVADGTVEQIEKLEGLIKSKLSFFQGSKDDWEVRSLRFDRGAPGGMVKQALLDNPDFLNQHTDSNSTGMIELTDPPSGESAVRDLREWKNQKGNAFLRDVTEGKIHYYFSGDLHKQTTFYKQGKNPEIFSVIRYLTKAFQYDLEIREEDRPVIERIIREFKASTMIQDNYAKNWIEKHAKKLVLHAVNIEYALKTLEELGLKKKLIAIRNDATTERSLSWWLSKKPLPSRPMSQTPTAPKGARTITDIARERNIPIDDFVVAHETSDFLAYESITRDTTGKPNVLISRTNTLGEAAGYGDGFYTQIGKRGARGTGMTIRFKPDPTAVEGVDFIYVPEQQFVVFQNRSVLRVIPESLNLTPVQYLELLAHSEADSSDRGLFEKLRRKLQSRIELQGLTSEERTRIHELFSEAVKNLKKPKDFDRPLTAEYFSVSRWQREFPGHGEAVRTRIRDILRTAAKKKDAVTLQNLAMGTFTQPHAAAWREELQLLIQAAAEMKDAETLDNLIRVTFCEPHAAQWREELRFLIQTAAEMKDAQTLQSLAWRTFSQPHAAAWREELRLFLQTAIELKDALTLQYLAWRTFCQPHAATWTTEAALLLRGLMKSPDIDNAFVLAWYSKIPHSGPEWDRLRAIAAIQNRAEAIDILDREFLKIPTKAKPDCSVAFGRVSP